MAFNARHKATATFEPERDVPCYRMEWSLEESPFEPLAAALGLEPL
jgi:hypothetical protein